MKHELKCWPRFYHPIVQGVKRFEYRVADRPFAVGDTLWLREWDPVSGLYTGAQTTVRIDYILWIAGDGRFTTREDDAAHAVLSITTAPAEGQDKEG